MLAFPFLEWIWLLPPVVMVIGWRLWHRINQRRQARYFRRRSRQTATVASLPDMRHKPAWVWPEVLRLATYYPKPSCRRVADQFNRLHGHRVTVGKSAVARQLAAHAAQIAYRRRQMRSRLPRPVVVNHTWAMDLTYSVSVQGAVSVILGIITTVPGGCCVCGHCLVNAP